eukprot:scaffold5662_cov57-Attheya_sp.AAC.8
MQNSWQNKLPEVLKILHVLRAVEYCHAPATLLPCSPPQQMCSKKITFCDHYFALCNFSREDRGPSILVKFTMASASRATPPQYTSYQERYLYVITDVFQGNYKESLSVFKMKASESGRATDKIFDQVLATMAMQPHTNYLMMTSGEPDANSVCAYHIQVLQRPSVYTVPMGSTSESAGVVAAFMGDVRSGLSPNLVLFPEKPFLPLTQLISESPIWQSWDPTRTTRPLWKPSPSTH